MALPYLAVGALKLGSAYLQYKNATAKNVEKERRLKEKMRFGKFSSEQEGQIVGGVAKTASNVAQETKSDVTGNLIAGGMGGSIAGVRAKADVDKTALSKVTDTREAVEFSEASAMSQAKDEYADYKEAEAERNRQATGQYMGSIADVGIGAITGTGDFDAPGMGWGEYKNVTTNVKQGDKIQVEINGKLVEAVWNEEEQRYIPTGGS